MSSENNSTGGLFIFVIVPLLLFGGFIAFRFYSSTTQMIPANNLPVATTAIEPKETIIEVIEKKDDAPKQPWAGIISDALGKPIAGALVTFQGQTEKKVVASSDDNGNFLLLLSSDDLTQPSPLVTIEADGYYQIRTNLASIADWNYTLYRGGTLSGQVLGHVFVYSDEEVPPPTPLPGSIVEVSGQAGWFSEVVSDAEGRYRITAPPGKIIVTVRSDTHADVRFDDLEVGRDEVLGRDLVLPGGITLDAFVMSSSEPLIGARVRVSNEIEKEIEGTSDAGGKARIPGLIAGLAKVHITHPGYQEAAFEMILPNDKIGIRRPFLLQPANKFMLVVTNRDGDELPDATVSIKRNRLKVVNCKASDSEAMSILASGATYYIQAKHRYQSEGKEIVLPPRTYRFTMPEEGPGELTIELRPGGRISGVVVAANGQPIPGATVLIQARGVEEGEAPPPRLTQTMPDGLFRTEPFSAGDWTVSISHPQVGNFRLETSVEEGKDRSLGTLTLRP